MLSTFVRCSEHLVYLEGYLSDGPSIPVDAMHTSDGQQTIAGAMLIKQISKHFSQTQYASITRSDTSLQFHSLSIGRINIVDTQSSFLTLTPEPSAAEHWFSLSPLLSHGRHVPELHVELDTILHGRNHCCVGTSKSVY